MSTKFNLKSKLNPAVALLGLVLTACTSMAADPQSSDLSVTPSTPTAVQEVKIEPEALATETPVSLSVDSPESPLSQAEVDGIIFMREEEKLARDVYLYLYQVWGSQVFSNIAKSEDAHMQAVLGLINQYQLSDPAANTEQGEFINPDLQALYDQLVAQGSIALKDAFLVGAAIEEIDILDLQDSIADTQRDDLVRVYENLLKGSYNHLQAFTKNISNQTGETYLPQYLTQEAFDSIIAISPGNGQRGRWGNGGN